MPAAHLENFPRLPQNEEKQDGTSTGRDLKKEIQRNSSSRRRQIARFRNDRQPRRAFLAIWAAAEFPDFARWPRAQRSDRDREAGLRRWPQHSPLVILH